MQVANYKYYIQDQFCQLGQTHPYTDRLNTITALQSTAGSQIIINISTSLKQIQEKQL